VQHPEIAAVAKELGAQNLVFGTDSDAGMEEDPLARRYDLTDDPVGYEKIRMKVADNIRKAAHLQLAALGSTSGYEAVLKSLVASLRVARTAAKNAAYHLGGRVVSHRFPRDGGVEPPIRPVHSDYQRSALAVIRDFVRDDYWHGTQERALRLFSLMSILWRGQKRARIPTRTHAHAHTHPHTHLHLQT
jgi:hypothetical protein